MPDQDVPLENDANNRDVQGRAAGVAEPRDVNGQPTGERVVPSELGSRLTEARQRFQSTVAAMRAACLAMEEDGSPPDFRLVRDLGDCHRLFARLRQEIVQAAGAAPLGALSSLREMEDLVGGRIVAHEAPPPEVPSGPAEHVLPEPPPEPVQAVATEEAVEPDVSPADMEVVTPQEPIVALDVVEQNPEAIVTPYESMPVETPQEPIVALDVVEQNAEAVIATYEPLPAETTAPEAVAAVAEPALEPEPATPGRSHEEAEAIRRTALEVLDSVGKLAPCDGLEFEGLTNCRDRARELRDRIAGAPVDALPDEAVQLASGEHVFVSLLRVVAGVDDLTDAQWASHHARISEEFGRQLAVAVARSRLVFGS